MIKTKISLGASLAVLAAVGAMSFSTTAQAEECLLDDGFLPGFADGFDTTGGATSGAGDSLACGEGADASGL